METEILNTPLPQYNNTGMCHSKAMCEYCIAEPWRGFCGCAGGRRVSTLYSAWFLPGVACAAEFLGVLGI